MNDAMVLLKSGKRGKKKPAINAGFYCLGHLEK